MFNPYPLLRTACAAITLLFSAAAFAQGLAATITGVEGIVQVRQGPTDPWQKAAVGMDLNEGAEFRTGPRSAVRFTIPPDQTITLDRLGVVKLLEALKSANGIKTDLGMPYGRVRYDIEAAGLEHASTIRTPSAVLAVRGTRVSIYDQPPFTPQVVSLTGQAEFRNFNKQRIAFGGKNRKTAVSSDSSSAAATAGKNARLDAYPVLQSEQQAREQSYLARHQGSLFGNVASSNVPVTDAELPSLLPGRLNFVLRWSAVPKGTFADLNLVISSTAGDTFGNPPFLLSLFPDAPEVRQFLSKNFPSTSRQGGAVGLNHIGPEGIEIATFGNKVPRSAFVVGAYNFLYQPKVPVDPGAARIPFRMEVFLDGKRQPLVTNLNDVLNHGARPVFSRVYRDDLAVGELAAAAVNIQPGRSAKSTARAAAARASAAPKWQSSSTSAIPSARQRHTLASQNPARPQGGAHAD